jgi:uncharacterized protein (DUF885 family)
VTAPDEPIPSEAAADEPFQALAGSILDGFLERNPVEASELGEHRYDDRLDDMRPESLDETRRWLSTSLARLAAADARTLSPDNAVDAQILGTALEQQLFLLDEIRAHEWNPLQANPGNGVYLILARNYAPLPERLRALTGRLAAIPEALSVARANLGPMPRVHLETAIGQFTGARTLLATELERALRNVESMRSEVEPARDAAVEAIEEHVGWLRDQLAAVESGVARERDPRIGPDLFARKLAYALDAASPAEVILARARADLEAISERIKVAAARLVGGSPNAPGLIRNVLDQLAEERPDNDTIVGLARETLAATTEFVRAQDLVTVYDDPVEIIVMPEIHRGVAVAYCDPPGPLEPALLPTFYAISPTPSDWPPERVESFFREYNSHMIHNLTVHEAMPGHVLQLAHSRRFQAPTRVRAAFGSGPFVEGWAVYAEELMADRGYADDAVRMQQLKMQLRMIINAILDARVHADGMSQAEAMALMTERGFQEEGEAVGKWRRALLTSAQLSTYYVGYTEVSDLMRGLGAARSDLSTRQLHDTVLSHGSPPPRHLRSLLGLQAGS